MKVPTVVSVLVAVLLALVPVTVASAHISVWPSRSTPGAFEHYVVYVPAEKPGVPSVGLHLFIPSGVVVDGTAQAPGWTVSARRTRGRITVLSWSGGRILPDQYAAFGFAARNPESGRAITWQAIQVYGDGTSVAWTGRAGTSRPAAVTLLDTGPSDARASAGSPSDPSAITLIALALGAIGCVCGLTSLGLLIVVIRQRLLS